MQILCLNLTPEAAPLPRAALSQGWEGSSHGPGGCSASPQVGQAKARPSPHRHGMRTLRLRKGTRSPLYWGSPACRGSPRCPLCTVPGLVALLAWPGAAWEPGGERAGRRGSPRGQFPSSVRPHSHWAFLEMAAGLLLAAGGYGAGGGAVPYQSWSRTSPWQMWRERELQTVEG